MSLLRSLQRARQQSHSLVGRPSCGSRVAEQPGASEDVAAGRLCTRSEAATHHAACSAATQTGLGPAADGWLVSPGAHSLQTTGWSAIRRGHCSAAARTAEMAAPNMEDNVNAPGLIARSGDVPGHTGLAGSDRQPDGAAAGQTETAFHAGSETTTTPWLPRPEATYQAAGTARASARPTLSNVTGSDSSSSAAASTEPLTAKAAFYRMRAALRSRDPSTALDMFSPDAQASGLSLTQRMLTSFASSRTRRGRLTRASSSLCTLCEAMCSFEHSEHSSIFGALSQNSTPEPGSKPSVRPHRWQGTRSELADMWDAAVYAHADRGDPVAAAAAVDAMRARRIPVGYVAHSCVVRAFCTADDYEVCCEGYITF